MTDKHVRDTLELALFIIDGEVSDDKEFWNFLKNKFDYDPDQDEEFQEYALKATQAECIGAAVARVLGIRTAHVAWDDMPWTRDEARAEYAEVQGSFSKTDLIEEMIESMSDVELRDFMIALEQED